MKSLRANTRKPTHPGAILREDILPELPFSQVELANRLRISPRRLSNLLHERCRVTPDLAIRLARFFATTAHSWLQMQQAVDIWELEHQKLREYELIQQYVSPQSGVGRMDRQPASF